MRLLPWLLLFLLLAGCAHDRSRHPAAPGAAEAPAGVHDDLSRPQAERYARARDAAPETDPAMLERVAGLAEPVPRVEPRSRYGNGPTYTVRGRSYRVLDSARGYRERGIASWYGSKFHGHRTSSLEPYDMYAFSAAHRTLPLPSFARVTNLENGRSVVVRINDRGPFHDDRLIDLSWAAAVRLGTIARGTGLVEVEAIDPQAPAEPGPAPVVTADGTGASLFLQVGAYADRENAERMLARLRRLGLADAHISVEPGAATQLARVRLGPLPDVEALDRASAILSRHGIESARVIIQSNSEE